MFWNKKEPIVEGQSSCIDKIFALKNIRDCKRFVFELFKWLRTHKDNIAFLKVESKDINFVVISADNYKKLIDSSIKLNEAQEDIYYIKEIIKQMESEEKEI